MVGAIPKGIWDTKVESAHSLCGCVLNINDTFYGKRKCGRGVYL